MNPQFRQVTTLVSVYAVIGCFCLGLIDFEAYEVITPDNAYQVIELLQLCHDPQTSHFAWTAEECPGDQNRIVSRIIAEFAPDSHSLAFTQSDGTVQIWHISEGMPGYTLSGHDNTIWDLCFSNTYSNLVGIGRWNTLHIWDIKTGEHVVAPVYIEGSTTHNLACSPDGQWVATAGSNRIQIWDLQTGTLVRSLFVPENEGPIPGTILEIAFAPDGETIAAGARDGRAIMWNPGADEVRHILTGHSELEGIDIAYSPDSQLLASVSWEGTIILWETSSGKDVLSYRIIDMELGDSEIDIQFGPLGRVLVTNRPLRLWDASTGHLLQRFPDQFGPISRVSLSPDGATLASSVEISNAISIWDAATGKLLRELTGHTDSVLSLTYSPDGRFVLTSSADGTIRLWGVRG